MFYRFMESKRMPLRHWHESFEILFYPIRKPFRDGPGFDENDNARNNGDRIQNNAENIHRRQMLVRRVMLRTGERHQVLCKIHSAIQQAHQDYAPGHQSDEA
jgi:hypothetical protein